MKQTNDFYGAVLREKITCDYNIAKQFNEITNIWFADLIPVLRHVEIQYCGPYYGWGEYVDAPELEEYTIEEYTDFVELIDFHFP